MASKTFSATITPLMADGSLDKAGLKNILERNIRHGLTGVFLLGSMGEWGSFSNDFKEEYVKTASDIIGNKMELLVGINATSLPLSLDNMKRYSQYQFDSYVFMHPARTSALDPVKSLLKVLDSADRPVYFYYCPPNNNVTLSIKQFETVMKHPNLKGIKNSSSDMWLRKELIFLRNEKGYKTLFMEGNEWAIDEALMVGCDGMISGMGALASKVMVNIAKAADDNDWVKANRLQNIFIDIFHGVYGFDLANVWNGQKQALVELGLCSTAYTIAQEMDTLTDDAKARIAACLKKYQAELD